MPGRWAVVFRPKSQPTPIGQRRRLLENSEGVDDFARHGLATDFEILQAALGLRAPIFIVGHLNLAHRVFFNAVFHGKLPVVQFRFQP